jgi:M6 family metalloprotease-like protein
MRKFSIIWLLLTFLLVPQSAKASNPSNILNLDECRKYGNNSKESPTRFEDGGHIQDWSNFLKPQGKIRTLIIPIDFSDAPNQTSLESIQVFGDQVDQEFTKLSNSRLDLEITVATEWFRMPQEARFYLAANWTQKINDALDVSNTKIDFSKFDLILIKVDEKNSPIDSAGALPMWKEHLYDGVDVVRGAFLGNDYWTRNGQGVQVAVHEITHVFGLPDFYQQNPDGLFPVGIFDLMSTFRLQFNLNLLGWNKWKLGWLDESNLKCISPTIPELLVYPKVSSERSSVFIPLQDKVLGIELWSDSKYSDKTYALIYEVSPKTYVWASNKDSGKVSPIQLIKPNGTKSQNGVAPELNLAAMFNTGDFIEKYGLTIRFLGSGSDGFYVSVTPIGSKELQIPKQDMPMGGKSSREDVLKARDLPRKTTLICYKDKSIKKVSTINPKCPPGFKKK